MGRLPSRRDDGGVRVRRLHKVDDGHPPATVLVVDDDESDRSVIRAALSTDPRITVVAEAANAADAVQAARAHTLGVIVLDHVLRRGEVGIDLASELRSVAKDAHIVLCSAIDVLARAERSPAVDTMVSKHHLDRLLPTVQRLLQLPPD